MFLGQTFSRVAVEDEKRDAIRILLIGGGVCKSSVLMQTLDQEIVLRESRITPTTAQCKLRVNPFFYAFTQSRRTAAAKNYYSSSAPS